MKNLARQRWDAVEQNDKGMRDFFKTAPMERCFSAYDVLRKQYELAGTLLNERVQSEEVEKCSNPDCNVVFGNGVRWFHRDTVKDKETQIVRNVFSCSQACFIANKRFTQTGFNKF